MKVNIQMMNVKDGDAIIIHLSKKNNDLVMVIDGGHKTDYQNKVKAPLNELLSSLGKKGPDVVVCTHYDSDHIGGLIPLLEEYGSHIQQLWLHKVPAVFSKNKDIINEMLSNRELKYLNRTEAFVFEQYVKDKKAGPLNEIIRNSQLALESVNELRTLISLISPAKIKQVFHKDAPLKDWQEISVLGPTEEYFNSLFPEDQKLEEFLLKESQLMILEEPASITEAAEITKRTIPPCELLKTDSSDLTLVNRISIIIAIDTPDKKRFLFTGDAGIESFKEIPGYQSELKNIYWLKIPHHGSNNNMSSDLATLINPVYAYCSGNRYQDDEVLKCLGLKSNNKEVRSTKDEGDLTFPL